MFQACVAVNETGDMFLRITQNGEFVPELVALWCADKRLFARARWTRIVVFLVALSVVMTSRAWLKSKSHPHCVTHISLVFFFFEIFTFLKFLNFFILFHFPFFLITEQGADPRTPRFFLTLTSSVTGPGLAEALKFFATVPHGLVFCLPPCVLLFLHTFCRFWRLDKEYYKIKDLFPWFVSSEP